MALLLLLAFCTIFMATAEPDTLPQHHRLGDGQTLVSSGKRFELGFFSPTDSCDRYLSIWYKNLPHTPVWVANIDNPIKSGHGYVEVRRGRILLHNGTDYSWVAYLGKEAKTPVLQILDSGNLIVRDVKDNCSESYLWESFDHPGNTLLPGMRLGWNLKTGCQNFLTSWISDDVPSTGDFKFSLESPEAPQLVLRTGLEKEYRFGPWDGVKFSGSRKPTSKNLVFESMLLSNPEGVYYKFDVVDKSIPMRMLLNPQGFIEYLTWRNRSNEWITLTTLHKDSCDPYNVCGPNGICFGDEPNCQCLLGFTPKYPQDWHLDDWSGGCIQKWPANCSSGEGFLRFESLKLPDNAHVLPFQNLGPQECEEECLKNCSCSAYAEINVHGNGTRCVTWYGDLTDMRNLPKDGNGIYVRMAKAELDAIAKAKRKRPVKEVLIILLSMASCTVLFGVIGCVICHKSRRNRRAGNRCEPFQYNLFRDNMGDRAGVELEFPQFNLVTISAATNHFSFQNMIGQGGFGQVFKGTLSNGQEIAVKRLSRNSCQGSQEFKNEVILIANLQHRNLVKLLGCCIQGEERMLIYEYLPNKSLDHFLFDQTRKRFLTWRKRLNIIVGVARGLLYLHQDSRLRIIHRDLKTSNILLDAEMNPKISDFGLARIFGGDQTQDVTRRVIGTYGYMSPEYAMNGFFSVKSDAFSFGVMVLEIVTGKRNWGFCHRDHDLNLIGHAWKLWNEGKAMELIDEQMEGSFVASEAIKCIQVALLCVQQHVRDRPLMSSVVFMLSSEGSVVQEPKEPGFYALGLSQGMDSDQCTVNYLTISTLEGR